MHAYIFREASRQADRQTGRQAGGRDVGGRRYVSGWVGGRVAGCM